MSAPRERQQADPLIDEEAERVIVGFLLSVPERLDEVEIEPADFGSPRPALALWAILEQHRRGVRVNALSVSQFLRDTGKLAEAGGPAELMRYDREAGELLGMLPAGVADQVARVKDLAGRRAMRASLRAGLESLSRWDTPVGTLAMESAAKLTEMGALGGTRVPTADLYLERSVQRVEAAQKGQRGEKYILTGLEPWDRYVGGLARRRVTVLAAYGGVGKSSVFNTVALSLAEGWEGREPERVYYGHLEDEGESFTDRHLAAVSGLSLRELGSKGLSREQLEAVFDSQAKLHEAMKRIRLDDRRRLTVRQVIATARHYVRTEGVRVVLVDHAMQMLASLDRLAERMWELTNALADFAHEEDVAVGLALHLAAADEKGRGGARQDAVYMRPTLGMMAGGQAISRVARTIVGARLCPPPRKPAALTELEKARVKQPPKSLTEEALEKWQEEQRRVAAKYEGEAARYERSCRDRKNRIALSVVKANEGEVGVEFWLERVPHAALVDRHKGSAFRDEELGYTPGPNSSKKPEE